MAAAALASCAWAADYYVDPVTGSMSNPGTAASPWSTLAAVAAAKLPAEPKIFQPGDHLYLRRGNHGTASITGINTGDVFIEAEPGHTPVVRISLFNAHHWSFKGLTILGGVIIDTQANENSDVNTFESCYMPSGGFQVYGNNITLRGNHIRGGGILFGFHSNSGLVSGNTLEDFYSDGMHNQGNYGVWENNLVMNSHKINGNHNDLFQSLASVGNVLRGNEFRAYTDPNQADLIAPGVSDVQGIGLFDGWYTDWVIENNVVLVDHPIGIWIQGAINCKIKNNTVLRCGQNSLFPYLYSPARFPNIRVAAKKSGAASSGNVVLNNVAERFELDPAIDNSGVSVGITTNNIVVAKSAFTSTFLDWAKKDLRLKAGASAVINTGTASNAPPATDADGNARPFGAAWDCGAYEYGYSPTSADTTPPAKPTGLSAVTVAGYGVDLHWTASTDNRKVTGYDIYRNGVQVGRTRAGTNYLDINADTTASYTVQALDHADNTSPLSDPVGGAPPVPDTQAPSTPSNVVACALSASSIQVSWPPSSDNTAVTAYEVFRGNTPLGNSTSTNYTDTGLTASTPYSYTVKAKDFAGNASAASAAADATTLAPDLTAPSIPANVTATALSSGSIQLRWSAATDNRGVAGYTVYRDVEVLDTATVTNYMDAGLNAQTLYTYAVTAFDAEGNESAPSAAATATTLEPVPVLAGESFEYADGAILNGLDGGAGWDGPWTAGYNAAFPPSVKTGNLGPYPGLDASGGQLQFWTVGNGTTYENLDRSFESLIADGGQTVWFAMMIALCNSKNAATWSLTGLTTDAAGITNAALFATTANGTPTPFTFCGSTLFTGGTTYTPHLILMKIVMSGDTSAETLTAYADPALSADPATWTGVTRSTLYANGGLIGFSYRGGRASTATPNTEFHMDEIRLCSTWQAAVGQTGTPPPSGDTFPPSVPSNVTAVAQSTNSIRVTWSASTDNVGVAGYEVYRGATLAGRPAATDLTDTGLASSTLYTYTVKAIDATGNVSSASAPASATTLSPELPPVTEGKVLVEETFDSYTTNVAINGLNGGSGWTAPWVSTRPATYTTIVAGNVAGQGTGNKMSLGYSSTTPQNSRTFTAIDDATDATYWLAFHLQATQLKSSHTLSLNGTAGTFITMTAATAGASPTYQFFGTTVVAPATATVQSFLVKIAMSAAGNDTLTCYVNPDLLASPSTWTVAATNSQELVAITGMTLRGNQNTGTYATYLDDIRLATTWQAAVGQPAAVNPDANGNGLPDVWETAHFGGTNNPLGAAGYDFDHDGINNSDEYRAGTDPTNAASVLRVTGIGRPAATELVLQWQSVPGKTYAVQSATNLLAGFRDTSDSNLVASGGAMSRTVTVDQASSGFYRVSVSP